MERRQDTNPFEVRITYWRRHLVALQPGSESALMQIASDAQRAENPISYLNAYANDLYNRLQGLDDSSDEEMDAVPVVTTRATPPPQKAKTEVKSKASEDSSDYNYTGLFGTSLSASERASIMGSGDDSALRAKLEKDRAEASKPFNDGPGSVGSKTFTCGGTSHGFSASSAKRHVEKYVAERGFPSGMSTMADVRNSLLQAASALVDAGTLGNKGFGACATYQVNASFTWNLIIERKGTSGSNYSIEHADINGIY